MSAETLPVKKSYDIRFKLVPGFNKLIAVARLNLFFTEFVKSSLPDKLREECLVAEKDTPDVIKWINENIFIVDQEEQVVISAVGGKMGIFNKSSLEGRTVLEIKKITRAELLELL